MRYVTDYVQFCHMYLAINYKQISCSPGYSIWKQQLVYIIFIYIY